MLQRCRCRGARHRTHNARAARRDWKGQRQLLLGVGVVLAAALAAVRVEAQGSVRLGYCIDGAGGSEPGPPAWLAQLKHRARAFPQDFRLQSNWPQGQACAKPQGWPNLEVPSMCYHDNLLNGAIDMVSVDAFKIYNRTLWTNSKSTFFEMEDMPYGTRRDPYASYRLKWIEAIMVGLWAYDNVPDMEFPASFLDTPKVCNLSMPVLQYSVFDRHSKAQPHTPLDEDPADTLCHPGLSAMNNTYREACRQYNQGFAIPNPDAWSLGMSPTQLLKYTDCILTCSRSTSSLADRQPVAFWRGTNSGGGKGWSVQAITALQQQARRNDAHCLMQTILNKRVYMALMAAHYPWMDVKLTNVHPNYALGCGGNSSALLKQVEAIVQGVPVDGAEIARNLLLINIDGWGPAYRLPFLLMSMTPVVHVESIMKTWMTPFFHPHTHYAPAASDLRDLPAVTHHLVARHKTPEGLAHLEAMATAARDQGLEAFNLLSQVDAVFSAAYASTRACGWTVEPPSEAQGWRRVSVNNNRQAYPWITRAFRHASLQSTGEVIAAAFGTGGDGVAEAAAAAKAREEEAARAKEEEAKNPHKGQNSVFQQMFGVSDNSGRKMLRHYGNMEALVARG